MVKIIFGNISNVFHTAQYENVFKIKVGQNGYVSIMKLILNVGNKYFCYQKVISQFYSLRQMSAIRKLIRFTSDRSPMGIDIL